MDVLTRDRMLRLTGIELRDMAHAVQPPAAGPMMTDPAEPITPADADRDYGDELDRAELDDGTAVVARAEGVLTVESDAGDRTMVHAGPSPGEAQGWADYIEDGLDLDEGEVTFEDGLQVTRTAGGLLLRWPEGDEHADAEDLDGVDLSDGDAVMFAQALRDMAQVTADHQPANDEGRSAADTTALTRHRMLQLLGLEVRAVDPKHPHYGKGVAGGKGGQFRPISDRVIEALTKGGDGDPLTGFTQPQLKKAAEQLGLNPPKGMRLVPLKGLLIAHGRGEHAGKPQTPSVPTPDKPPTPKVAKAVPLMPDGKPDLDKMTIAQLRAYADQNNLPVKSSRTKADLIANIRHQQTGRLTVMGKKFRAEDAAGRPKLADPGDRPDLPAAPSAGGRIAKAEADILDAYKRNRRPGEWIGIADLRADLDTKGYSREEQDAALLNLLHHEPNVRIIPVANTKALKPEDHKAAIHLGGEALHAFSVDPKYPYPKQPRPAAPSAGPEIQVASNLKDLTNLQILQGDHLTPAGRRAIDSLGPAGHPRIAAIDDVEGKIRETYRMLAVPGTGTDHYVALSDVRKLIGEQASRIEVDAALKGMAHLPDVHLSSQHYGRSNAETRIPNALIMGGQEVDHLYIADPTLARPSQFGALAMADELDARRVGKSGDPMMALLSDAELQAEIGARVARDPMVAQDMARRKGIEAVPAPKSPKSAPKRRAAPRAPKADPAKLSADFAAAIERPMPSDVARLKKDLTGLTGAQLADLAIVHGVKLPAGTKQKKVDFLVEQKIGFRLDGEKIRHSSDEPRIKAIDAEMKAADLRGDRAAYGRLHQERVNLQQLGMTPDDAKASAGPKGDPPAAMPSPADDRARLADIGKRVRALGGDEEAMLALLKGEKLDAAQLKRLADEMNVPFTVSDGGRGPTSKSAREKTIAAAIAVHNRRTGGLGLGPHAADKPPAAAPALEGPRAIDAVPVSAAIDASNSDSSTWRATGFTGVSKNDREAVEAVTAYLRRPGQMNTRLRFRDDPAHPLHEQTIAEIQGWEPVDTAAVGAAADKADRRIAALDRVMDQSKISSDIVTWRGVSSEAAQGLEGLSAGDTFTDAGFVSTSTDRSVAEKSFADGALMRIRAVTGTPALSLAGLGEQEVLLGRGLRLRIVGESTTPAGIRLLDVEVLLDALETAPSALDPQQRDRTLQLATRAAGHDVTPGHDQLHHYWTRDPKGLARWVESATPWQTLVDNLVEEVKDKPLEVLEKWASRWYIEVFGYAANSDKARVAHGKPPRGHLVGPG